MKQKKKKQVSKTLVGIKKSSRLVLSLALRHKFMTFFVILSIAAIVVIRDNNRYLNPVRDESKYSSIIEEDKKDIGKYQVLQNFRSLFNSEKVTISPKLPVNRSNPFTEN